MRKENVTKEVVYVHSKEIDMLSLIDSANIEEKDGYKQVIIGDEIVVTFPSKIKASNISINLHKLLKLLLVDFTKNNTISETIDESKIAREITIDKDDYIKKLYPNITTKNTYYEARKNFKKDLEALSELFLERLKKDENIDDNEIFSKKTKLTEIKELSNKFITIEITPKFAKFLMNQPMTKSDPKLLKIGKNHSNAYRIANKLSVHYNNENNKKRKTNDRLKVKTILKNMILDNAKKEWKKTKQSLENNLEYLVNRVISKWEFCGVNGMPICIESIDNFNDFLNLNIKFEIKDDCDNSVVIVKDDEIEAKDVLNFNNKEILEICHTKIDYEHLNKDVKEKCLFGLLEKGTKRPIHCKSNDPSGFKSFKNIMIDLRRNNNCILCVPTFGNVCGVDIDKCIDDDGNISKLALEIIKFFNSYTEISPSGKGIRILFLCDQEQKFYHEKEGYGLKNNETKVEIYQGEIDHRVLSVTGNAIKDIAMVKLDYDELSFFFNKYMKKQKKEIKKQGNENGFQNNNVGSFPVEDDWLEYALRYDKKLKGYWDEVANNPLIDQSVHDLKLLSRLAFWSNKNVDEMIKVFEESPYFRSKDDYHIKKWARADYKQNTLSIAIERTPRTSYENRKRYYDYDVVLS